MIGWEPLRDVMSITKGDLIFSRTRSEGPIPTGTVIEIIWDDGPTWLATSIAGNTVGWRIESAELAAIDSGDTFTIWVRYPNGDTETTDDYEWIKGSAQRPLDEGF
ncbi:LtfC-like domain-containing protein [Rhodococcus erythropolis]|uniref:LtfC-like domain-containing protein n=1 Tax=Rhodococcus erythropolis TaxID=1833 RepID=UPI001BE9668F|nr:hypothetical protein [Rhodococcus erythropolis]MBT2268774.1 hypothetical protein [Rhodococcus erythropolis]